LPVPYFHAVFTLPDILNTLCLYKTKEVYSILFDTAWQVINTFGHDHKWLGAQSGMIAILHTWGQTLSLHPHLHCIVPAGGLTKQHKWKVARTNGKYLFSVKAMSKVFRGKFMAALKERLPRELSQQCINGLYKKEWVVYAKRPFQGPQSVIEYLGRYTHKIAISNHRIKNVEAGKVTFSYKDYRQRAVTKEMTLEATEFIRRFALHILPKGFVRIRHYGILSSTSKIKSAVLIKDQVPTVTHLLTQDNSIYNPSQCPCCKKKTMQTIMRFNHRGPPADWQVIAKNILECIG
jgi:hypothetical protein